MYLLYFIYAKETKVKLICVISPIITEFLPYFFGWVNSIGVEREEEGRRVAK